MSTTKISDIIIITATSVLYKSVVPNLFLARDHFDFSVFCKDHHIQNK